jgi:hypothetical protein
MNKSRKFAALLAIILIAFSGTVRAQDADDGEEHGLYLAKPRLFYGGLVAGANFSQVDGDYFAGYRRIGLNAGGIVYAQLAKHLAVSMEILYDQKGSKSDGAQISPGNSAVGIIKYGIKANYAEIPVMVNYFDRHKSNFGLGFSYARLVSGSESITVDSANTPVRTFDLSDKYPFKKSDFNFLAGVNLHLVKGLYLNVRFQYSLVPIRSGDGLPPIEYARTNQYNNLWVVRLMYLVQ